MSTKFNFYSQNLEMYLHNSSMVNQTETKKLNNVYINTIIFVDIWSSNVDKLHYILTMNNEVH